jgi:uncharacterized protein (DUF58 family)
MTANPNSGALELRLVIDRFSALSECALRACDSGDGVALSAALDARDVLTTQVTALAAELASARRELHSPAARRDFDALVAPLQDAVREATRLNQRLAERASSVRADVARQLERLNHDGAAVTAYSTLPPRALLSRFDHTR